MQVRLECTADGLIGNWIELNEVWTRGELKRWNLAVIGALPESELFALLETKVTATHLYLPDGTLITSGKTMVERFDDMDSRLVRWLASGISQAQRDLLALGEAKKRLLFDGVEIAVKQQETPTAK